MFTKNATDIRKNWSSTINEAAYEKPVFIKRNRNRLCLINLDLFKDSLLSFTFSATQTTENDLVTLTSEEFGISETGKDLEEAKFLLAKAILKYANQFYSDFSYWSGVPNRKQQIPYVLRAIIEEKPQKVRDLIIVK